MSLQIGHKITLAIGSAAAVVIAVAIVGAVETKRLIADADWVAHTHDVRAELLAVSRHIDAAKGDIRGFLLTGDTSYLARHRDDLDTTERAFALVERSTTDNPAQQRRLATARASLDERERAFQQTLALDYRPGRPIAPVVERVAIGERIAARLDSTLHAADAAEVELLGERARRERRSAAFVVGASTALVALAVGLAFLLWRSIERDLAGRSRAEAELRASEAKFAGILDIAVDAVITIDQRQQIVNFNHGAEVIFGYHRSEVLGGPIERLLPARHKAHHAAHIRAFSTGPDTARPMGERRQIHGRRKNGDEFSAEASISKLVTPRGALFTAVLRDVTARERREQYDHSLVAAGAQLAGTIDYAGTLESVAALPVPWVGAWCVLVVAEANESGELALRRIAAPHPDPALDALLREWEREPIHWDSPEVIIDVLRTEAAQRHSSVSDDWIEAHSAGPSQAETTRALIAHSLMIVPLIGPNRVLGAWMIGSSAEQRLDDFDDVLAKALADRAAMAIENAVLFRRAQRATAARDQVLSVVSHDLRNPLSAVSMLSRRLADDELAAGEHRSIGANILSSVDWMHRLMQDLLDAASIEAGRLAVELEPQVVAPIFEAVVAMFAVGSAEKGIGLATELRPAMPRVLADGSRVVQVLANLVGNAMKFTPAGGTIALGARPLDGEVVFSVRDTGVGIPADDLPHVFDRFWHARRNSGVRGTGLGLAIADGIVRAHGGRMWVESVVGEGSTFSFTLPQSRVKASEAVAVGALPRERATTS